jgi:hypothetical protein
VQSVALLIRVIRIIRGFLFLPLLVSIRVYSWLTSRIRPATLSASVRSTIRVEGCENDVIEAHGARVGDFNELRALALADQLAPNGPSRNRLDGTISKSERDQ